MKRITEFLSIGLLTFGLLALADVAAHHATEQLGRPLVRDLNYYQAFYALAATLALVTPAFWMFILQRKDGPSRAWRNLWTCGLVAFMVHLYWTNSAMGEGDCSDALVGAASVDAWRYGVTLASWWLFDVVFAWKMPNRPPWVRLQRGALHLALFIGLVAASLPRGQGLVLVLGVVLLISVLVSAALRVLLRPYDAESLVGRAFPLLFRSINRFMDWHRLPTWLGVLNLAALRQTLRANNLHDTKDIPISNPQNVTTTPPYEPGRLFKRDDDGFYNDLRTPTMGASAETTARGDALTSIQAVENSAHFNRCHPGARFGRNVALAEAFPDEKNLLNPNPRVISNELLARDTFKPATTLNMLAAAWIQFETHDWFNHGEPLFEDEPARDPSLPFTPAQCRSHRVPVPDGDRWHEDPIRIRPTRPDPTRDYDKERREHGGRLRHPPTYANASSHWWDGSQIYGSDPQTTLRLRSDFKRDHDGNLLRDDNNHLIPTGELLADGKLFVGQNGLSLDPSTGTAFAGLIGNWWVGLSLMHNLFAREHNAICDAIRREYPYWSGEQIFTVARLVNAALMAKIHTVEWTPAILGHPALQVAMDANWWGLLTERIKKLFGRLSENESFGGIPGSGVEHGAADFALTEEFVSVYRMHTLMPDRLAILSARDGRTLKEYVLPDGVIGDESWLTVLDEGASMSDLLYSFGVAHPGANTLHNYPNFLRRLQRPPQFGVTEVIDLAAIDILRDRERGVPRYNRMRRLLGCPPIASFDDFKNPLFPTLGADLRRIYGTTADGRDDVEMLDLMIGMFAEVPPAGFGFSDTAFRIFIVMASRRLKSDRFIASDFTPEVYTQVGLDWVENTSMRDVLVRHYPALQPALYGVENAFAPWKRVEVNPASASAT
ncbi:peroxidase family protein [Nannocystis sp. SCPEA4]|uniref:peroxidase family protein n=1 Tax=Nannocystis sp. SCPEA4 TaxID=2996787 RepID=UPI00226EBBBF|nr:peroxidase family protein [Nannocystis sp. SCPEA4]MCY1059384.1 hypothetical protein [Nannocystis sp. SCPEA4]